MSNAKTIFTPLTLYHRPNRRVMVTPQGGVMLPSRPGTKAQIAWEGFVVETATNDPVAVYPTLSGSDVIHSNRGQAGQEIVQLYIDKCRFVDGVKPDIELLQKNVNAGVWEVATQVKGTKPL